MVKRVPKCRSCQWYTYGATPPFLDKFKHFCDHPAKINRTVLTKTEINTTSPKCCPIRRNWDDRLNSSFKMLPGGRIMMNAHQSIEKTQNDLNEQMQKDAEKFMKKFMKKIKTKGGKKMNKYEILKELTNHCGHKCKLYPCKDKKLCQEALKNILEEVKDLQIKNRILSNDLERQKTQKVEDVEFVDCTVKVIYENIVGVVCERYYTNREKNISISLKDIEDRAKDKDGEVITVIAKSALVGEVYIYGNHGDFWELVGKTKGYA